MMESFKSGSPNCKHIHIYIYTYTYKYTSIYTHTSISTWIEINIYLRVNIYKHINIYIYLHISTYSTWVKIYSGILQVWVSQLGAYSYTNIYKYTNISTFTYTYAYKHPNRNIWWHPSSLGLSVVNIFIFMCIQTNRQIHTHIHL
jgi:hypothetical protein